MNHKMKLFDEPFERMKLGKKKIEFRLYDEKRQKVKVGDYIEFVNKGDVLKMKVIGLYIYDSFKNLVEDLPFELLGRDDLTKKEFWNSMYKIYSKENELKYGVLGIRLEN